jgi:hypothetical protein
MAQTGSGGGELSQVAREFQNLSLRNDLKGIPGIGPKGVQHLEKAGIRTTNGLMAKYFGLERDEAALARYLQEIGIKKSFADACARAIHRKFGAL